MDYKNQTLKRRPQSSARATLALPAGAVLYETLRTDILDWNGMVTGLQNSGFAGYMRLVTENAWGVVLFSGGMAMECIFVSENTESIGQEAVALFAHSLSEGNGALDLCELSSELMAALIQSRHSYALHAGMKSEWVKLPALVSSLEGENFDGHVVIHASEGSSVAFFNNGRITASYSDASTQVKENADPILAAAKDKEALVEVHIVGNSTPIELDLGSGLAA